MKRVKIWVGVPLLLLNACAAQQAYTTGSAGASPATMAAGGIQDYKLSPADKVRITVFNEPTLSGDFSIGQSGLISLPLIGDVQVKDMTVAQAGEAIQGKLANGYLRDPKVAVEVLSFRPFYVLGEVNQAGEYPYSGQMTALQAIASAHGFSYRAKKDRVFIKRAGSDVEESVPLTSTLMIGPGDTVRVAERYF